MRTPRSRRLRSALSALADVWRELCTRRAPTGPSKKLSRFGVEETMAALMNRVSVPVIAIVLMAVAPPAVTQGAGEGQTRRGREPGGVTNSCIPMNRQTQDADRDGCDPAIRGGDRGDCEPGMRDVDQSCDPMTSPSRLVFDQASSQKVRLPWPNTLRVIHRFAD